MLHRDLSTGNVLLRYDDSQPQLLLSDFGMACPTDDSSDSYVTTREYRAPEMIWGHCEYGLPVDLFSAGCVAAEFFNDGQVLFDRKYASSGIGDHQPSPPHRGHRRPSQSQFTYLLKLLLELVGMQIVSI